MTDEGILGLSSLSGLRSLSYGYTSMPEADDVAAAIGKQFKHLTGVTSLIEQSTLASTPCCVHNAGALTEHQPSRCCAECHRGEQAFDRAL